MLLLAFLKSMDPLFRNAKSRILDSREKLILFKSLVRDPNQLKRMDACVGKGGEDLLDQESGESKIKVDLYREAAEKLDKFNPELGKEIKNASKPMHKYCADHRDLVHHLVFMNHPLYRPKWKRDVNNKDRGDSDWSATDEEADPAEPLANESDPRDYTKNGSGWPGYAEPSEQPLDSIKADTPLENGCSPESELEAELDPSTPLAHEDYEEDYRDRSLDPPDFGEIKSDPPCPESIPDKLESKDPGEKLPYVEIPPADIERDVLKWINQYRSNPASCVTLIDKYLAEGHPEFKKEHLTETKTWLNSIEPMTPLQRIEGLSLASRDHVKDIAATGKVTTTGSDGSSLP